MKLLSLFILFLFLSLCANAQPDPAKIIGIHPAVGKTISQNEKILYHLFSEYSDSLFESAQIFKYNDTTYQLVIRSVHGVESKSYPTFSELDKIYYSIENVAAARRMHIDTNEYAATENKKAGINTKAKNMKLPPTL